MRTTPRDRRRTEDGRTSPTVVGAVALVALIVTVGVWTSTRENVNGAGPGPGGATTGAASSGQPVDDGHGDGNGDNNGKGDDNGDGNGDDCTPTAERPGPAVDLGIQASRGQQKPAMLTEAQVRALVGKAKDAGATVISTSASFRALKPVAGGAYRFENLDRVVNIASAEGLDVKLRMTGTPSWALDDGATNPRQAPRSDAELAKWETFVGDVMRHLDGKVQYVEVWTEPNSQRYWPTGPDPVEFARLLDVSARAIHTVDPDTAVVSGGLRGNDVGYLRALYDAFDTIGLAAPPFDMLGVEPFNGGGDPAAYDEGLVYTVEPFGDVDGNFLGFESLHNVMVKNGDRDGQVYITLFGYSTVGNKDNPGVDDATRAAYLTSALELATCRPYVGVFSWYAFHPNPWDPPSWTLVDAHGRPTRTYDALVAWGAQGAA